MTYERKIVKFALCRRRKIWIAAPKLEETLINAGYHFVLLCVYYSAELDG